jgi:hypothetical protein
LQKSPEVLDTAGNVAAHTVGIQVFQFSGRHLVRLEDAISAPGGKALHLGLNGGCHIYG